MPIALNFRIHNEREIFIFIKEDTLPYESIQLLKTQVHNILKFEDTWTYDDIIKRIEDTLEEYNCTLIPFTVFVIEV